MTQAELIKIFLEGSTAGKAGNLRICGSQLIHYNTAIAERYDGGIILNNTRYSLVTGKIQKMVAEAAGKSIEVKKLLSVKEGTTSPLHELLCKREADKQAEPQDSVALINHSKFGKGEVIAVENDTIKVRFADRERQFFLPLVLSNGVVGIVSDPDQLISENVQKVNANG
jgi:hypothetical protein